MEWLILAALVAIIIILFAILKNLQLMNSKQSDTDKHLATLYGEITAVHTEVKKKGGVTDPFQAANKSHVVGATSKHIVVRKTPDQIRAENAEAIKNGGKSYGSPV